MKKDYIIIPIIFIIILSVIPFLPKPGCRVFKIESPEKIYIDINKNNIFDEKEPVIIKDINYIKVNEDYSSNDILKQLKPEQKIFLSYMAKEYSKLLLNKRYVDYINDDIYIKNKSYKSQMIESKYAYDNSLESQSNLLNYINSINLDEYVIYNPRSKKYHKLNCPEALKLNNYKIKRLDEIKDIATPCKACHIQSDKKEINVTYKRHPQENIQNIANVKDILEKENITVYFINLNEIFKPSNKCDIKACKSLKEEINSAKETIDFAIYGINNQPEIVNALVNAQNRGVKIRWVYDINKSSQNYYEDNEKLAKLIPSFKTDEAYEKSNPSAIMHNKFFIFDNSKVWTGSANITSTDLSGFNANYAILIKSKELAQIYTDEFNQMYSGKFHKQKNNINSQEISINNSTKIKAVFSPQHNTMKTEIIPLIDNAKSYIYIPMFFITSKDCANALINAHKRGVEIKIIHDATNAHAKNTTHKTLREAGIKVKTENFAGKMHAKAIIIDDKTAAIGSMNYTNSGNNKNDENVVIISDEEITKYLKETFIYLWNRISQKYETFDPRAESFESIGSCYDGIDNNFDNKIDTEDDGCKVK